MGLVTIGAGLRVHDLLRPRAPIIVPVMLKLAFFPALLVAIATTFGVDGQELLYLALCAAVPTAMNGYLLARQLGGDAELYAAATTMQTIIAFFTIPMVLAVTAQLAG
jgi:predicted permease